MVLFKKNCIRCGKLFRPSGKTSKICDNCKTKKRKERWEKERKESPKKLKKIVDEIKCPNCETKIDISEIKAAIIDRIYLNLKDLFKI